MIRNNLYIILGWPTSCVVAGPWIAAYSQVAYGVERRCQWSYDACATVQARLVGRGAHPFSFSFLVNGHRRWLVRSFSSTSLSPLVYSYHLPTIHPVTWILVFFGFPFAFSSLSLFCFAVLWIEGPPLTLPLGLSYSQYHSLKYISAENVSGCRLPLLVRRKPLRSLQRGCSLVWA